MEKLMASMFRTFPQLAPNAHAQTKTSAQLKTLVGGNR
jgi:hypothetical protein